MYESERYCADHIDPFLGLRGCPDKEQPFNSREEVRLLRNNEQTWAAIASNEFGKVNGHGLPIMGDKDSRIARCHGQRSEVIQAAKAGFRGRSEIYTRLSAKDTGNDVLIEVGVCLEPYLHEPEACVSWRISSSLLNKRGLAWRTFWRSTSNSDSPCRR